MALNPELVELLRCPKCHGRLALTSDSSGFTCAACRLLYPVIDDIPQLLVEEARPFEG